jgi:hypothetical protein
MSTMKVNASQCWTTRIVAGAPVAARRADGAASGGAIPTSPSISA